MVQQARVPFAEDDLPTVALEASAVGNTKKDCVVKIIPHLNNQKRKQLLGNLPSH